MSYPLKTHCLRGHALDEQNTYHYPRMQKGKLSPIRICKKCAAARRRQDRINRYKKLPCDNCGEVGRIKALAVRGQYVRYFCHDEEVSCYNFRRGTYFSY